VAEEVDPAVVDRFEAPVGRHQHILDSDVRADRRRDLAAEIDDIAGRLALVVAIGIGLCVAAIAHADHTGTANAVQRGCAGRLQCHRNGGGEYGGEDEQSSHRNPDWLSIWGTLRSIGQGRNGRPRLAFTSVAEAGSAVLTKRALRVLGPRPQTGISRDSGPDFQHAPLPFPYLWFAP